MASVRLLPALLPTLLSTLKVLTFLSYLGEEFQALFLSTTEPMDSAGNTTNPTKSPCNPYVFNTVLTRSKSLVVAVGSPVALLGIEEHMVKKYGSKARCWSSYLRICLEKGTFSIPPSVEPSKIKAKQFELRLKANLFDSEVSKIASQLADVIDLQKQAHKGTTPALKQASPSLSTTSARPKPMLGPKPIQERPVPVLMLQKPEESVSTPESTHSRKKGSSYVG